MKVLKEPLLMNGPFFSLFQAPSALRSSVVEPSSFSTCSHSSSPPCDQDLVTTAVGILKHQRSKSRWSYLRSVLTTTHNGLTPSQFSQIALQLRNNPHLALHFFQFTVRHSLCIHSLSSYATTIHILSRSRHKARAQDLIHSAIRHFPGPNSGSPPPIFETLIRTYRTCDSAPFVFDLLIKACIESKRTDQAIEIVRMLRSKNVHSGISTINALIELVTKSRGCFAGYDFYREIFGFDVENQTGSGKGIKIVIPNSNTFNVIMVAFLRDGLVAKVEEVWNDMLRMNVVPNVYSYSVLMEAYCENGKMEDAERVWDAMRVEVVQHDTVAYNTMIGGFCGIGDVERAEEIFREMSSSGVESTCVTFEHLINGYCKLGDVDSLIPLYHDMCRKGFRPESTTVDALMKVLCQSGKVSEAFEIFKHAMKKHSIFPKKKSFEFLIKGLCQEGSMEEALKLQAVMIGKGYEPDEEIYGVFIDGYVKQGNDEMAQRLKKEMLTISTPAENG